MESRLAELFQLICNTGASYSIGHLSKQFKVTERTIFSDIEKINSYLKISEFPEIQIENKQINYPTITYISFADILTNKSELVILDGEFRKKQLLLDILINQESFSIAKLTERYGLSKNTIIKEIKEIRAMLSTQGILLKPIAFIGYHLSGDEIIIRKLAASLFPVAKINIFDSDDFIKQTKRIELVLNDLFNSLNKRVAQNAFERLVAYFWVSFARYQKGNFVPEKKGAFNSCNEASLLINTESIKNMFPKINEHPEELAYLADKITEASLLESNEIVPDDWLSWNFITIDFINSVGEHSGITHFSADNKLIEGILVHLKPAVKRLKNNEELTNPLYQDVVTKFYSLNNAVLKSLPNLEMKLGVGFTLQESSFLTLFFAASLQRKQFQKQRLNNIIIVCNEGISTSQILNSRLQRFFNFNILGTFSKREAIVWQETNQIDLIISTVNLPNAKYPVIKVDPMLSSRDIEEIQRKSNISLKEIHIDDILSIIKKHFLLNTEQENAVYSDLELLLQENTFEKITKKAGYEPMLIEVLTESSINANFVAESREEAVKEAGRLLVANGAATESYIDGMLENVEINGTYIVIAPGIAMPHARPEKGALKIGFSLVTLKEPVKFDHPTNDPVSLVIGLCATDHQKHLKALSELVELLSNQKNVDQINQAADASQIYKIIKGGIAND